MQIEVEKAISSETIQKLITSGICEGTKKLQTQSNTLQNKIGTLPKDTRGASSARAPTKKKHAANDKKDKNKNKKKEDNEGI